MRVESNAVLNTTINGQIEKNMNREEQRAIVGFVLLFLLGLVITYWPW